MAQSRGRGVSPGVTCCPEPGLGEIWGCASAARRVPAPLPGSAQSPRSPPGSRGQMSPGQWRGDRDLAVPLSPRPWRRRGRAGPGLPWAGPRGSGMSGCSGPGGAASARLDPAGISTAGDRAGHGVAWLGTGRQSTAGSSRPPRERPRTPQGSAPLRGRMRPGGRCLAAPGDRRHPGNARDPGSHLMSVLG